MLKKEPHPLRSFIGRVYNRSADDGVFFLGSGLTFNVVLASIPFLLLLISIPTLFLEARMEGFQEEALLWLWRILPLEAGEVRATLREELQTIVDSAGSITLISAILFVWLSTRLFGALRTALSVVFDIEDTHGVIKGKLKDIQLVVVSTLLLTLNIGLSAFLEIGGVDWLVRIGIPARPLQQVTALATAFATVFVMFLLIYKFLPAKRLKWRTAAVAALFAALTFEVLKYGFTSYIAQANYESIFFAFWTIIALVVAVYYSSVLFLIGGEVAQAYEVHRIIRRQREIFD